MTWATVDDMLARFNRDDNRELSQLLSAGDDPDLIAIQDALDEAQAIIGGYLSGRQMSVADNANLRRIQCDLARWTLYLDRVPERVQQIYEADIGMLKALRSRETSLGGDPGGGATAEIAEIAATSTYYRGF